MNIYQLYFPYDQIVQIAEKVTSGKRIFAVCAVGILSRICVPWTVMGGYVPVGFSIKPNTLCILATSFFLNNFSAHAS